jgi:Flp pilus assembly protein TadD
LTLLALPARGAGGDEDGGADPYAGKSKEFQAAAAALSKGDYRRASELFARVVEATPNDADAFNLLGYSHRKLGDYDAALRFYGRALGLDPKHKGAHEYIGETYLLLGDLARAKEHLAQLDRICWLSCEAYRDLKRAIAAYEARPR